VRDQVSYPNKTIRYSNTELYRNTLGEIGAAASSRSARATCQLFALPVSQFLPRFTATVTRTWAYLLHLPS
jgi:hypothetical protein